GDIKSVASGSQQKFAVVLEKKIIGRIKLDVTYKANFSAIEGAVVSLSKDSTLISTKQTGPDGLAEFGVGEQVQYKIVVDKDGYLIETLEVLPREEPYSVALELATVKNSQSLAVTIVDETGNPVEDVRLSLRSAIDESAVAETITGLNGTGFFERVKDGQYYVSALKPGFGETVSQAIELNARQQNAIQLSLEIGFGNVEVAILGEKNEPVAGANVSLINFITGEILERGVTNAQGVTTLRTRADKIAFAVASAFDYLPYTSVPVQVGKDNTNSLQLNLKKEIAALSLEFVGLVFEGKTVKDSATPLLNAGQSYGAKFLLLVPAGSAFDEAGVHIRTGVAQEGVSNILEKDGIFLRDALAAFNEILRGTSYTPQNGFGTDAVHYTSSDAKWVEMRFNEPVPGVYEIVVDLAVRENAKQGEALDLWYRAFGKSGGYVRFPADEVLGSKESTAEKQALYAQAKNKKFSVGPSSLCIENFCTLMSVENISEQVQTSVVDEFLADTSSKYRLKFSISSISDEVFPAVELKVEESAGAIEIKNFEVVNTGGAKVSGTAVGSTFSANIGDVRQDDIFSGVFEFEPKVEGIANLAIELFSGNLPAKEKIFENNLLLNISPASELVVEIVPKIIVPFVNNNLLLRVTEKEGEAPVSNALVTLKKGSTILAQGHTNREGIFPATIPAQNAGTVISVFVEKHGFKTAQLDIAVTENIVQTIPAEIKEHLVVGEKPQKELTISLLNLTQIPLTINSIEPSSAFDELVEFDFDQKIVGQILDVNGSADTTFTFSLTKAGEELKQPATVSGAVNVEVTNKELSKSWHSKIPTEIRIGFGDEVDQADCLSFSQTAWSIFSSLRGTKTLSLSIQNNCRVNGAAIPVGPLQAKLNLGAQNPVGEFKARVQIEGEIKQFSEDETANLAEKEINLQASNSIVLGTSFKEISATIPANNEATLSLEFSPQNVASAQQEFSIDFRAAHTTKKAIEFIRNKISVMLAINDLAECINILPQENLRLTTCPFNTGYDFFPNNFSGQ
ncbi:MAG: carboxypeptidase regulatory-like domain-containing protein, partial [Candidatus Diapherotrites archaeon]|nr:carboxypeptidase regulatory-like domain-containing protein [Candidatus Diapherotrites archaeon]